jgi:hypothetical protein
MSGGEGLRRSDCEDSESCERIGESIDANPAARGAGPQTLPRQHRGNRAGLGSRPSGGICARAPVAWGILAILRSHDVERKKKGEDMSADEQSGKKIMTAHPR